MNTKERFQPASLLFELACFLCELLDPFNVHLPLRMQALVLLWVSVFLLAHQMLQSR